MPRKAQTEPVSDLNAAPGGAAAVDRALSLLSAFRPGDDALTLAQFAERTHFYKSTALRLLASLEHARMVRRQEDGRYALGMEIARLHALYAASFSLDDVVLPVLRNLVAATGESAAYHVRQQQGEGWARLCLYRIDSPHVVRDHVRAGDLLPVDRGAGARILIAFGPQAGRRGDAKERQLYEAIRAQGYCALVGDRTAELAGISAPVFHGDGRLAAAVTLTMPTHRYDERYVEPVRTAARRLDGEV
ncbi:IclR family transcriptional regulator [Variovorax sp. J2P1-59]|uniref:IclR family transcriptional regulator n=1 Tax=Variovorax flavidus TaxID=3053501 RepID=UPI002576C896|nr:IclR family transcriptional regulator [Variovorax sp. J2P1-59]MDM0074919.1 IclR family transcriptional regulator [Variovorax sp. J2P1-59]